MRRNEKCFLLAGLCAFEGLLRDAVAKVGDEQLFDNMTDPDCAFIWTMLQDYHKSCGDLPKPGALKGEIEIRLGNIPGLPPEMVESTRQLADWITIKLHEELNEEHSRQYLFEAVAEGVRVKWSRGVAKLQSIEDMAKHAERARRDMALLQAPVMDARCDIFGSPEKFLVAQTRRPTCIHPLDMILGGGIASGEIMGFVAPTGCGKTSCCVAMASDWVMNNENVMLFTYEQEAKGDIAERFYSYTLNESVELFRDKSYDMLDDELKARMAIIRDALGDKLTIVNMADPNLKLQMDARDPVADIREYVERNAKEGRPPALVMMDWFGAKVLQVASFAQRQYESPYQVFGQSIIDGFRELASKHQFAGVITQQLSTEASKKSPSVKPMNTDVLNFKTFFNFMDCGVLLGTQTKGKIRVGHAVVGKNRRGSTGDRMIAFDGEHGKLDDAGGNWVEDHLGRIVPKDAREYDGGKNV